MKENLQEINIFEECQKNKDKFVALIKSGIFEMQSGKAEVNIHNNQIQSVYLWQMTFKRKSYPPYSPLDNI